MNGAEALVATAISQGIEICFANPGTTEMPLVLALDWSLACAASFAYTRTWATGAADGYGRMTGKPAMCLLPQGPGLANGPPICTMPGALSRRAKRHWPTCHLASACRSSASD